MKGKAEITLNDIAAELYVVPPGEFIAARAARAEEAQDADLAKQVRALRKPLLAAWVVNLFTREHADELGEALELAEQLQEAQKDLDAQTLSTLSRQRRALVHGLARKAGELAADSGERVTQSTLDAVEQTLNAAMFDVEAAAAVATGRLIRPLEAAGGHQGSLGNVVAGDVELAEPKRPAPVDEVKARRVRKEAEQAVREAEKQLERTERRHDEAQRRWREAGARADELHQRTEVLEAELSDLAEQAATAQSKLDLLGKERAAAEEAATQARNAAEEARTRLDD